MSFVIFPFADRDRGVPGDQAQLLREVLIELTPQLGPESHQAALKIEHASRTDGRVAALDEMEKTAILEAVDALFRERRLVTELREVRDAIRRELDVDEE